ncbi:MAG TPA: hypothetical protein V6D20_10410 [Candidatus Obscuribacterales bacterium]
MRHVGSNISSHIYNIALGGDATPSSDRLSSATGRGSRARSAPFLDRDRPYNCFHNCLYNGS